MRPLYFFLLFGLTLSILFSSGQIENPDTHLRLTQARIILDDYRFGLPKDVGEDTHGNIAINRDGQRYMVYNPGQTIAFIPIYLMVYLIFPNEVTAYYHTAFFVSFINFFVHALCAFLLFKIALLLSVTKKQAYLASIFFGLTSYSFVFAQSTYEHHIEMFFILLSTYYALRNDISQSGFISGLMLSFGLIFRTTSLLAVPAVLLIQKDKIERFKACLSLTLGIVFILLYNYYRFGNPLESGYSLAWSMAHSDRFDFWSYAGVPAAIIGFLFSPAKGLLFFSTTLIFSFAGIKRFREQHSRIFYAVILISVAYIGAFSLNFAWHGSIWSFGPRYILPIIPFLYLPLVCLEPPKWIFKILVLTFIFQLELISVNYKRDVLNDFIVCNGISDTKYIYAKNKEPHLVQAKQLMIIIPKNFRKLNNYMPNSPWKKEIRTASNADVLNFSIEKNSLNFWWLRIFHLNSSLLIRLITVIVLLFGFILAIILYQRVKKEFI